MDESAATLALVEFAKHVRADRRANPAIAGDGTALELLLAPRFHSLLEALLALMFPLPPRVLPEYRKGDVGRPDLAFARESRPACSFIELKRPEASLTPARLRGHDADQFRRFGDLPLWGFCNFHTIALYRRAEQLDQAVILPAIALDPVTSDAQAERLIRRHDTAPFRTILETLALATPRPPRTAPEAAEELAHAARLVRAVVRAQCQHGAPPALAAVPDEFRDTLFAHPTAGGFAGSEDDLFANAFAQTLTFGLLLAHEASGADIDRDAYRSLPGGAYPLLRATLRALTQDEILDVLGAAFGVVQQTVNAVGPTLLMPRGGADPILYFYEDFLGVFDPEAKKRHGVFFTPVPIVRFMVEETDRALRRALGTKGLLDPDVLLLDPACGTGTFLIAAASAGAEMARSMYGDGAVAQEVAALASRLHGFELLVGPYTVAHYRLLREVAANGVVPVRRLPIYLADTLAPPAGAKRVVSHLGFMSQPIVEEREAADTLKRETPILAIIGNPPYRRLGEGEEAAITSGWGNGFWEDLKTPVRDAGWGGEAGIESDENVFAIQAGVCIVIAVAAGAARERGQEADVRYADVWRHKAFDAKDKLALLSGSRTEGALLTFVDVARSDLDDFVPAPFGGIDCPALPDLFVFQSSGIQSSETASCMLSATRYCTNGSLNCSPHPRRARRLCFMKRATEKFPLPLRRDGILPRSKARPIGLSTFGGST